MHIYFKICARLNNIFVYIFSLAKAVLDMKGNKKFIFI